MGLTELSSHRFVAVEFIARFYTHQHCSQRMGE